MTRFGGSAWVPGVVLKENRLIDGARNGSKVTFSSAFGLSLHGRGLRLYYSV